jgi:SAM-dependent methyltransferase
MELSELNADYWNRRYDEGSTGWDVGYVSTPLKEYIDQLENKELKILVPGAGNGYEVAYLFEQGFQDVHILDFARTSIEAFLERNQTFPSKNAHIEDFFAHDGQYDLIIEQTFFCALHPDLRSSYARKVHNLLVDGGRLVGVLWDDPMFADHPPYGGNAEEYERLFNSYFDLELAPCFNSIKPRAGRELFIKAKK